MSLEGFQHKEDLDAFVKEVCGAVCAIHGLDPDGAYEVNVGFDDVEGRWITASMPNRERFEDDVRAALEYVFSKPRVDIMQIARKWDEFNQANAAIKKQFDDAPLEASRVERLISGYINDDE